MTKHLSPHDRLVRTIMGKPKVIKEFFNNYLPTHIKSVVNLDSIKLQKESFIDDKLRLQITDLLYTAQFGMRQGYLYLLIEHASSPNKHLSFRLLKYKIAIMDHHLKITGDKYLPVVYPLILYSGKRPFNYSTDIFDLFGDQRRLAEDILYKPYQLVDLRLISDEELKTQLWFGVMARIMKYIYSKDILPYFKSVILDLRNIQKNGDSDYIYNIISYLFETGGVPNKAEFINTIKTGLSIEEEKVMTLAEQFRAEGETIALHKMALKMLNKGLDTKEVSQITEISEKDLCELFAKTKKRQE